MKQILLFTAILILSFNVYSQKQIISSDTIKKVEKEIKIGVMHQKRVISTDTVKIKDDGFNLNKVYNKQTGKKITREEFNEFIKKNPKFYFERLYNEKGEITKYFIDPNSNKKSLSKSLNNQPKNGEFFPEFELRTIDNKKIKLKNLKGKFVIIRCELSATNPRLRKSEIIDLDKKVSTSKNKSKIELINVFRSSKEEIYQGFDLENYNSKFVPNGYGFYGRNHIKRFPSTFVIDKEGRLINIYFSSKEINIEELLGE